ncbi:uncharacterized protein LOC143608109 [Bidens hawaiensis]|uniref:uncharacterized protein LOC143608109 n=1 Tax=Bidens hawaiensis TaxID=980011 RepID=UPI004048F2FE
MDIILCDELLQEIFHRLPPPPSSAVSLVSKRWRRLLRSSTSSLTLRLSHHHPYPSFPSFLSDHTHLNSLTITTIISDHLLLSISGNCPNLTHLNLSGGSVSLHALLSLSTSCPLLNSLSLVLSRPVTSLRFLSSFPNLKAINLTLVGNTSVSDHFISSSTEEELLNLQSIYLSGIRPGDYAVNFLWSTCNHKALSHLGFQNCEGVGDYYYSFSTFIKGLQNLNQLQLKTCRSALFFVILFI